MIKKFYYNDLRTITIIYGPNGSYIGGTSENYTTRYGDVITDIDDEFCDLASRDLSDYGLAWDSKFYYDSGFTQQVAEPYTVNYNITFYVNIVDTVKYGIKVKGSGPEDFDTITGVSPFGTGHNYVEERCYTDTDGYYNIATTGYASAFNVYYNDQTIDHVYVPSHVLDMSSLYIGHNTCDLTITYDGTSTQFLTAVNGNSILNGSNSHIYTVICTDHTLTYDFTNHQWIVIS